MERSVGAAAAAVVVLLAVAMHATATLTVKKRGAAWSADGKAWTPLPATGLAITAEQAASGTLRVRMPC